MATYGGNSTRLLTQLFYRQAPPPIPTRTPNPNDDATIESRLEGSTWSWYTKTLEMGLERSEALRDYSEMDNDDLIATVLDAISEDGAQTDFMTDCAVWVESENPEIERIGTELFEDLDLQCRAGSLIREIAKNGDVFEFLHQERGRGVVAVEYIPPHIVWRVERYGSLRGFTIGMEPTENEEELTLPYQINHMIRPGGAMMRGPRYGDSWLRPARRLWRKYNMMEDAMIMYRLRRAPDRDVYYIDVTGVPPTQQVQLVNRYRTQFKKSMMVDSSVTTGNPERLRSEFNPLAPDEDVFWPTTRDNTSRVERLSGSSNVMDVHDIELMLNRMFGALRAPKEYFGFGDAGAFDRGKTLEQQDVRWGKGIGATQAGLRAGLVRLLQIHLSLLQIDPMSQANDFVIKMVQPSTLEELQRAELYDARLRAMQGLQQFVGEIENLDKTRWFAFLLEKFGRFRPSFLDKFLTEKPPEKDDNTGGLGGLGFPGGMGMEGRDLTREEKRRIVEALNKTQPNLLKRIAAAGGGTWSLRTHNRRGAYD